jgi:predicted amidohydrolase YtcJ
LVASGLYRAGLHLSIHAIGDKANHLLLDAYERLIEINGQKDRRMRIEHAQHLRCVFAWPQAYPPPHQHSIAADKPPPLLGLLFDREEDQLRMAKMGVIASMQPYHVSDDGRWADRVLGPKRTKEVRNYPLKRLSGVVGVA